MLFEICKFHNISTSKWSWKPHQQDSWFRWLAIVLCGSWEDGGGTESESANPAGRTCKITIKLYLWSRSKGDCHCRYLPSWEVSHIPYQPTLLSWWFSFSRLVRYGHVPWVNLLHHEASSTDILGYFGFHKELLTYYQLDGDCLKPWNNDSYY